MGLNCPPSPKASASPVAVVFRRRQSSFGNSRHCVCPLSSLYALSLQPFLPLPFSPGLRGHLLEPFPHTTPALRTPDTPWSRTGVLGNLGHENSSPHFPGAPPYWPCPSTEAFFKVLNRGRVQGRRGVTPTSPPPPSPWALTASESSNPGT